MDFMALIVKSKFADLAASLLLKRSETDTSSASESFARMAGGRREGGNVLLSSSTAGNASRLTNYYKGCYLYRASE